MVRKAEKRCISGRPHRHKNPPPWESIIPWLWHIPLNKVGACYGVRNQSVLNDAGISGYIILVR